MWRPIVEGAERAAALAAAGDIAAWLERVPRAYSFSPGHDLTLADGEAGIALFLAEIGRRDAAQRRLERAFAGIGAPGMDASLHLGYAGIAWVWQRVIGGDELEPIDRAIAKLATRDAAPGLLFGLAGLAVYAHERGLDGGAIAAALAASGERVDDGLRWRLPPANETYAVHFPDGFYDLGIDVGAAGIAAVASRIPAARVVVARAVGWLRAQRTDAGYPSKLGVAGGTAHAFGWCKGELGIAMAFLHADLDEAAAIGRRAALVDPATCDEPGFHIGAAGALHAFACLYEATGLAEFRDAARRWLARLLAIRGRVARQGLVAGAAGVGVALLAAATDACPTWDRALAGPH